jgi:O-antigen ligase
VPAAQVGTTPAESPRKGRALRTVLALTAFALTGALLIFAWQEIDGYLIVGGAAAFCAAGAAALSGGLAKKLIYAVFMVQIVASFFLPMSLAVTVVCMLFFIPVLLLSEEKEKTGGSLPCLGAMALMLAGWISSFVYVTLFVYSRHGFMIIYDIYLLLGLASAYMLFFLFRLRHLDVDKLVFYTALSGMVFVGATVAKYFVDGYANQIFSGRFGMRVSVNSSFLALYLNLALACSFFLALFEKGNALKKAFLYAVSAVYVMVIFMTASRGGIFGVAAIGLYVLWHKRSVLTFVGAAAAAAIAYFTFGANMIARFLNPSFDELLSNFGRVELMKAAVNILREHYFLLGIGMNNFAAQKFDYGFPAWFDSSRNAGFSSHNLFVEVWLGWGILGLAGWIIFNGWVLYALLRNKHERHRGAAIGVAFAIISFLLYGLGDSNIANFSMMFTYFSLIGVAFHIVTGKEGGKLVE